MASENVADAANANARDGGVSNATRGKRIIAIMTNAAEQSTNRQLFDSYRSAFPGDTGCPPFKKFKKIVSKARKRSGRNAAASAAGSAAAVKAPAPALAKSAGKVKAVPRDLDAAQTLKHVMWARDRLLQKSAAYFAVAIQARARTFLARGQKSFRLRQVVLMQAAARGRAARVTYGWAIWATTEIQRIWRGALARRALLKAIAAVTRIAARVRGNVARRRVSTLELSATAFQAIARRAAARMRYTRMRSACMSIQRAFRGHDQRRYAYVHALKIDRDEWKAAAMKHQRNANEWKAAAAKREIDRNEEVLRLKERLKEAEAKLAPFACPIEGCVPSQEDVVFSLVDGRVYDRDAIAAWLERNKTSPVTRAVMDHRDLFSINRPAGRAALATSSLFTGDHEPSAFNLCWQEGGTLHWVFMPPGNKQEPRLDSKALKLKSHPARGSRYTVKLSYERKTGSEKFGVFAVFVQDGDEQLVWPPDAYQVGCCSDGSGTGNAKLRIFDEPCSLVQVSVGCMFGMAARLEPFTKYGDDGHAVIGGARYNIPAQDFVDRKWSLSSSKDPNLSSGWGMPKFLPFADAILPNGCIHLFLRVD